MKRILVLSLLCAVPCIAHAADTMCVKPTTTVVVLDPAINGTALSSNATGKTWSTEFSYGIISGVGACYSNVCSSQGCIAANQTMSPYTNSGSYCYCKLLKPIESRWVYSGNATLSAGAGACSSSCAGYCASNASSAAALRRGMFGSIILP